MRLNDKQVEELAKLFLDLGKLVFGPLVLGLFQSSLRLWQAGLVAVSGLLLSMVLFILGIRLMKEVKR